MDHDQPTGDTQPQGLQALYKPVPAAGAHFYSSALVRMLGEQYAPSACGPSSLPCGPAFLESTREPPQKDHTEAEAARHALCISAVMAIPPSPTFLASITCLLEDMLVSVLMLLVSVTTIADGNREVWEYWGGSCLCVYTAETK